jgi:hypothetical protein
VIGLATHRFVLFALTAGGARQSPRVWMANEQARRSAVRSLKRDSMNPVYGRIDRAPALAGCQHASSSCPNQPPTIRHPANSFAGGIDHV